MSRLPEKDTEPPWMTQVRACFQRRQQRQQQQQQEQQQEQGQKDAGSYGAALARLEAMKEDGKSRVTVVVSASQAVPKPASTARQDDNE